MSDPLVLSPPETQDRLNATVFECARLRMTGPVFIPGCWDPRDTMDYFDHRAKTTVIRTTDSDFVFCNRRIRFLPDRVIIDPSRTETPGPACPAQSSACQTLCSPT